MKPRFVLLFFVLFLSLRNWACCAEDNRSLVQYLLETKNLTVFKCKILSTSTNTNFEVTSKALVLEVFLGKVTATEVTLNTGNEYSSTKASYFPAGMTVIIFGTGESAYFHCGGICDNRTLSVDGSKNALNAEEILRSYAKVCKSQKSRSLKFKNLDGTIAASGQIDKGIPSGLWKFYNDAGKLKLEYNYSNKDSKHYNNEGYLQRFQIHYLDSTVYVDFVDPANGIMRMKEVDFPNDTGFVGVFYEYFPSGVLKSIEGFIYLKEVGGGISSKGKTGKSLLFHENGKIRIAGEYRLDRRISVWKWFEKDGSLTAEVNYRNGEGNQ